MPLQIRRGTAAERSSLTTPLVIGELLYVTDQGKLYIGDGTSIGSADIAGNPSQGGKGLIVTGFTAEEAQDATNTLFGAGTHTNINFVYNDISNSLSATVDLSSYVGNISVAGIIDADFRGSVFAEDSTIMVDAVSGTIPYSVLSGAPTLISHFTNDAGYLTTGDLGGATSFNVDIKGSVFGDDSSIIVDAVENILNIPTIISTGNLTIKPVGITSIQSSVIVGSASNNINGNLHIVRNVFSNDFDSSLHITNSHSSNSVDPFYFRRTRGTPTVYTAVQTNDQLGRISFLGWDGTQFLESASLRSTVTNVSAGIVESSLILSTQDSTGTFITPLRLSNTGRLQLGTQGDTHNGMIDIVSNYRIGPSNDAGQPIVIRQFFNDQLSNSFGIQRARGTGISPTQVQDGDGIFQIQMTGYDGTVYQRTSAINFLVDGPVSSGVVPGLIQFRTAGLDGQILVRATIDSSGTINAIYGITGDLVGSVFADDSSIMVDAVSRVFIGDLTGNVTGNVSGNVTGNVIGNLTGDVTGDMKGSVFADDSSIMVDAVSRVFIGDLTGNVTGNVSGNVTGNIVGNVTGNVSGNVTGNVSGNVIGNLTGDVTGDMKGSVFADDSSIIINSTDEGRITTPSVTLSNFLQLPVYANDTARSTAISSPQQGMVVFMQSGTAPAVTDKPVIYNGSAWEAFEFKLFRIINL